jgi:hypothetical protein
MADSIFCKASTVARVYAGIIVVHMPNGQLYLKSHGPSFGHGSNFLYAHHILKDTYTKDGLHYLPRHVRSPKW